MWFDLHFPDDYWYWLPFHVSVGHLNVFFWKCLSRSSTNFESDICLLLIWWVLYPFCIPSLYQIWIANIFSHLGGCLFTLLITFFAVQKLFGLTCMLYPTWLFLLLVSNPKYHCQDWFQGGYHLCFLLRSFRIFWAYVQVSNLVSVKSKIAVQYHCFACYGPVFPKPLIKEIAFFPLYILDSFVMN